MSFPEFVAIKLGETPQRSTAYKALASYARSTPASDGAPVEDTLRTWIAGMIEGGLAPASRRRYVEKLSTIYKDYADAHAPASDPFEAVRDLRDFQATDTETLHADALRLSRVFDILMSEARTNPALAVFVYLLFNASSDIEAAINLTVDAYTPTFPQLADIVAPGQFHHRRRYVFNLSQSRKRIPQLLHEVTSAVQSYLHSRGLLLPAGFTGDTVQALWAARAASIGVSLPAIKAVLSDIPAGYSFLRYVPAAPLTSADIEDIKRKVAESFCPTGTRWYAFKLRRNVKFDFLRDYLRENLAGQFQPEMLFYPQKEIIRRVDRKIITESIPVIPDVVFFNVQPRQVRHIDMLLRSEGYGWVFRVANRPDSDYSAIDRKSMLTFQRVIGTLTPDMKVSLTRGTPIGIGRPVRITGGIMEGYTGTIYDIKDGSDVRQLYIRLSDEYAIRAEIKIEEYNVEPILQ